MEEHDYRYTRAELDSALDGELAVVRNDLNRIWFRIMDSERALSSAIEQLWKGHQTISRLMTETQLNDQLELAPSDETDEHQ